MHRIILKIGHQKTGWPLSAKDTAHNHTIVNRKTYMLYSAILSGHTVRTEHCGFPTFVFDGCFILMKHHNMILSPSGVFRVFVFATLHGIM